MGDGSQDFISVVREVWGSGAYGLSVSDFMSALAIFLFFAVLRGLFTRFVLGALKRITSRTKTEIDDLLREAIERPVKFFFIILGVFFALKALPLDGFLAELGDKVVRSLIAVGIFWTFYAAVTPLSIAVEQIKSLLSSEIIGWLMMTVRWGVVLTGVATVLQIWGIQIAPIIAGFGLFGMAVALGAQDLFKNLLGGVSILLERRFALGDWIEVEGVVEGTIEQIGFRSTHVRRFDQVSVVVPNNTFSDHALVNYSSMHQRRIKWTIGLEYRTTSAQLKTIRQGIFDWLDEDPRFISDSHDVPSLVHISGFNDSSIDMMVYCFTKSTRWYDWLDAKQDLALAIKQIVEQADAGFAFPSRSLYLETAIQSDETSR